MDVAWNSDTKIVTACNEKVKITLQIENIEASIGNENSGYIKTELDVPPRIINGRTMVPVRFIGEASGSMVAWDSNLKTVVIGKIMCLLT